MPPPLDMRTRAWLDQEDRRTSAIIREHRVYIESILGGPAARPPFAWQRRITESLLCES